MRSPILFPSLARNVGGPAAPSGLVVTSVNATGVTLGWTDNSTNEAGFYVEAKYNGGVWDTWPVSTSDANPTAANVVSYFGTTEDSHGGSHVGLSYLKFRVKSTNSFGSSAYSAEVQVPPSVVVIDLFAGPDGVNDVAVSWTDPVEYQSGADVYRSTNSGSSFHFLSNQEAVSGYFYSYDYGVRTNWSSAVLRYKIKYYNAAGYGPFSNVGTP